MPERHVTVSDAARLLGVSRRTIQRRVKAGELRMVEVGGAQRVVLDETSEITTTLATAPSDSDAEVSQLRAQVAALEAELGGVRAELDTTRQDRDRWHEHAERQGATIDRLTVTLAQLGDTVVEQRALSSGAPEQEVGEDTTRAPSSPWWRFWAR
ncbi:MAG: excisionase family DNA-binding protein [Chloroflexota bacterium]|nr:excisionase family DNA-binding protein [Chloroflexota bacterium]